MDEESACKVIQVLLKHKMDVWIRLTGISMEPAFYGVTRLRVVSAEKYRRGDVVLVCPSFAGGAFTHRIVAIDKSNKEMPYIIKGDNSYMYDNKTVPLVRQDILGRVVRAERADGSAVKKIESRLIALISYWEGKFNLPSYKAKRHDRIWRHHTIYLRLLCAIVGPKKGGITPLCGKN